MQQFQSSFQDSNSFARAVESWRDWRNRNHAGAVLIHIFSDGADEADVRLVRLLVEQILPDAAYVGASASGNLYEGYVSTEKLVVTCTIFERTDSFVRTELLSIADGDTESLRRSLRAMRENLKDVKAIEVLVTIDTIPIREVCAILQEELPPEIPIWGGGAFGDNTFTAYIFQKGSALNTHGIVMSFLGGNDLQFFMEKEYYTVSWSTSATLQRTTGRRLWQ